MHRETIFALSSGALPAGIAVVRVSGPLAFGALASLSDRPPPPLRMAAVRALATPATGPIDDALVLRFAGPASATGEDVVELHVHGGRAVVAALIAALAALPGLRLAMPGEFARQAFDNGRLDLAQVEGLADLIAAETEHQRRVALAHADGALSRAIAAWSARLTDLRIDAEAGLDFADGEDDVAARLVTRGDDEIVALQSDLDAALTGAAGGRALREGLTIVVTGPPNVGKSSLINCLARREVALVSPAPGTTRDAIEARLDLGGIVVTLVDTAGLRDSDDPVEAAGIARARVRAASADLVLALFRQGAIPGDGHPVRSMIDLDATPWLTPEGVIGVSTVTGAGIAQLEAWLTAWARGAAGSASASAGLVLNVRQAIAVRQARDSLDLVGGQSEPVLRAEGLRLAQRSLDGVTGANGVASILDGVFARFCIGK